MSTRKVIIDDRDTQILYSSGWHVDGSENEYQRTTSNTDIKGASFTFTFVGTSVAVYGTLDSLGHPNTTYILDDSDPFPFVGTPKRIARYQQEFYSSPIVPYGKHTLVGSCATEGAHVILDYFVFTIPLDFPTNITLPTATTTTSDPKPTYSVTIIVGSVLGGMVLMMIVLAVFLWCRWFRGSRASKSDTHIRPFDIDTSPTPSSSHNVLVAAENHKTALPQASPTSVV
ncbi:hypothetical protein AB1N83_004073 [Pleurotus pulmonarius]